MRWYLDENFPALAGCLLEGAGHEVWRAVDRHPHGALDDVHFADAQELKAVFLTTDRDFFHREAAFAPRLTAAVVVIALHRPSTALILARLRNWIDLLEAESFPSEAFLVTDWKIIRRR